MILESLGSLQGCLSTSSMHVMVIIFPIVISGVLESIVLLINNYASRVRLMNRSRCLSYEYRVMH